MKKLLFGLVILFLAGGLFLIWAGDEMKEVRTEVEIAAQPEVVWNELVNIDQWAEWSPIIKASSGNASMDAILNITMIGEDGKDGEAGPNYSPKIIVFDKPRLFHWRATMAAGFLFTNEKVFELIPTNEGTKLVHKELFGGLMSTLTWANVQRFVPGMLDSMNLALKKRVEAQKP